MAGKLPRRSPPSPPRRDSASPSGPKGARAGHGLWARLGLFGPALVVAVVALAVTYRFVQPAPPRHIVMAAGSESSVYYYYARAYRARFAHDGIDVELRLTRGSIDNVRMLEDGRADVGFVQSGATADIDAPNLRSLASLYYEPVWIFAREDLGLKRLGDLRGKRVAIDQEGSGTRALALQLLADNGLGPKDLTAEPLGGDAAAHALRDGGVDAAIFVMGAQAGAVHDLLTAPGIHLFSTDRTAAYILQHRFLSRLVLPEGAIDLPADLPPADTVLLAAAANLVAREDFHPALSELFLRAANELHGEPGLFEEAGEFPSRKFLEFPLSDAARRYFESGPSFLQRYLPFWAANLINRLVILALPLVTLIYPIFKIIPPTYDWRMRSRINRWYKELQAIETSFEQLPPREELMRRLADLDRIEAGVQRLAVPVSYGNPLYSLRLHIAMLRTELREAAAKSAETSSRVS
ncbi:MAG TPA: TAXI family TRAP transporter solute-binding subunit [Stellaceae bacterium]|nr:TAXI family TRAP transporter solute-binding subunit [Stellaceae bacterium]